METNEKVKGSGQPLEPKEKGRLNSILDYINEQLDYSENPLRTIVFLLLGNFILVFGAIELIEGGLPEQLHWIPIYAFPISILSAFAITMWSILEDNKEVGKQSAKIMVIFLSGVLILYGVSLTFNASEVKTKTSIEEAQSEFEIALASAGLSTNQISQIDSLIDSKNLVTHNDLKLAGLNSNQIDQVTTLLNRYGYVTATQVVEIIDTKNTQAAIGIINATQTADANTCFLVLNSDTKSTNIRSLPGLDGNVIGYLVQGMRLKVITHNNGTVNRDRWWYVEFSASNGETKRGWVASHLVVEVNNVACSQVR